MVGGIGLWPARDTGDQYGLIVVAHVPAHAFGWVIYGGRAWDDHGYVWLAVVWSFFFIGGGGEDGG